MPTPFAITLYPNGVGSLSINGQELNEHIGAGFTIEHRPDAPPLITATLVEPVKITAHADLRLDVPDDVAALLTAAGWVAPLTCWYCGETDGTDDCCRHSQAAT